MKRYDLIKVQQNGKDFYALIADPRIIARLLTQYNPGEEQEVQRPWVEKKVREIARYVAGKFSYDENKKAIGLIPNAPIINAKSKIALESDEHGPFVMLPETEAEIKNYVGNIEPIDGQHRIRAFLAEYIDTDFDTSNTYEMIFSLFFQLSKKEKEEIFMISNDKQDKVSSNLLRMYKRELDLLDGDEQVYDLVCLLDSEDFSPLKERIMIGAKKISKGYQESQISKILNKSELYKQLSAHTKNDNEKTAKLISFYIKAWEQVYGVSFQDPRTDTLTKISGIRYILFLMPAVIDILGQRHCSGTTSEFKKIIEMLPDAIGVSDVFTDPTTSPSFQGEGATITMAKNHSNLLKVYEQTNTNDFDITAGI